ncbi:MAG: histidinol phosphate phosphatase domain-containing protein [Candidatus Saganbacteria bacterium]|nr:histidinol phosphate phosphatase domain-containing protein [Candidatus Saganbacteria bacterium]
MKDLGKRIDLHTHSLLSDGMLLPSEAARYASNLGFQALAITDHVDYSNVESVISKLLRFTEKQAGLLDIDFIPGIEITHVDPRLVVGFAQYARTLGARLIVCHGETPSEPVMKGTNHAAVSEYDIIDILAHPGYITEEDAILAAKNNVCLELSSKPAHKETNRHVANMALKAGAKLLVNTDAHGPDDFLTQEKAFDIAKESGLDDAEAIKAVKDNPLELLNRIKRKFI